MNNLFSYMPDTYKNSKVMKDILDSQEGQLKKEEIRQYGIIADTHPSTCINPERWEKEYSIEPEETIERRRNNIKAKMRGNGDVTGRTIKDMVQEYVDGTVETMQDADDSMFYIDIETNETDQATINAIPKLYWIIPAHMDYKMRFYRPSSAAVHTAMMAGATLVRSIEAVTDYQRSYSREVSLDAQTAAVVGSTNSREIEEEQDDLSEDSTNE